MRDRLALSAGARGTGAHPLLLRATRFASACLALLALACGDDATPPAKPDALRELERQEAQLDAAAEPCFDEAVAPATRALACSEWQRLRGGSLLVLIDFGLTDIPEPLIETGQHIRRLNLARNALTEVPSAIGKLAELEDLDLSRNRLSGLPEEIAGLASLRRLNLDGNQLTALPASVGDMRSLETLVLDHNGLSALPETLSRLPNLETLSVSDNRLTSIPTVVSEIPTLRVLDVSGNPLGGLPQEIEAASGLRVLAARSLALTSLPAWLTRMGDLQALNVSDNALTTLPDQLLSLPGLEQVNAADNQIASLSLAWCRLEVTLSGNPLTPEAFRGQCEAAEAPTTSSSLHQDRLSNNGSSTPRSTP